MNFYAFDTSFNLTEFRWNGEDLFLTRTIGSAFTNAVDVGYNGESFAVLEDTSTTSYTLRIIRPNGSEIASTSVSPSNYRNPHSVDWDGRNWVVYFSSRTGIAPNTRERVHLAFHRRDSSHIFSTNAVRFGSLSGANGRKGCFIGANHLFIGNTGATGPSGAIADILVLRVSNSGILNVVDTTQLTQGVTYRGMVWDGRNVFVSSENGDLSIQRDYLSSDNRINVASMGAVYNGLCMNRNVRRAA